MCERKRMAKMVQGREENKFIDKVTSPISPISPPTGLTDYFILGKEPSKRAEIIKSSVSVRTGEMREMGETANGSVPKEEGPLCPRHADTHLSNVGSMIIFKLRGCSQ